MSADYLWLIFEINKTARPINLEESRETATPSIRFKQILIPMKIYFFSRYIFSMSH